MFDGMSLWPWWLWILSVLWIGALIFWQPVGSAVRERWGWGALALVYALLIVLGGRIAPASPVDAPPDSWLLWLGLLVFLGGAVTSIGLRRPRWQQIASSATAVGAAVTFVALHTPEAALACGAMGVILARKSAVSVVPDGGGAIHPQNVWLAGIAAVVTLVVVLGVVRQALIMESTRIGPSRWQSVFPTREQVARHHRQSGDADTQKPSVPMEAWGLAAIGLLATISRGMPTSREHSLSQDGLS